MVRASPEGTAGVTFLHGCLEGKHPGEGRGHLESCWPPVCGKWFLLYNLFLYVILFIYIPWQWQVLLLSYFLFLEVHMDWWNNAFVRFRLWNLTWNAAPWGKADPFGAVKTRFLPCFWGRQGQAKCCAGELPGRRAEHRSSHLCISFYFSMCAVHIKYK